MEHSVVPVAGVPLWAGTTGRGRVRLRCSRARRAVVGCAAGSCGSGAAGRRVDGCRRAATGLLQPDSRHHQRPCGARCRRPMVMTLAFPGVGACHVITGLALRPAAAPGRLLLMTGGVATALVAANPVTAGRGGSLPHTLAAAAAFIALAAWPLLGGRRGPSVPALLRPDGYSAAPVSRRECPIPLAWTSPTGPAEHPAASPPDARDRAGGPCSLPLEVPHLRAAPMGHSRNPAPGTAPAGPER